MRLLREVLSQDGKRSWSRVGSAAVVAAVVYVVITTRSIPERTEELARVLAAVYGVNHLGRLGEGLALARQVQNDDQRGRSLTQSTS